MQRKLLMRHVILPVTFERCNICIVTGEGTSFWNIVRHSFTINLVLVKFLSRLIGCVS